jgi:transcriptional regulator with XRE-family HTH domain
VTPTPRPTDPALPGVGDRLVRLRLARGFETRGKLASLLGIDQDTLATYENDRTTPPPTALVPLSDLLDCTIDHILTGSSRGMPAGTLAALAAVTDEQMDAARRPGPKPRHPPAGARP